MSTGVNKWSTDYVIINILGNIDNPKIYFVLIL